jgi:hypothetical protein
VRWSISLRANGDRYLEREEIVELADAVAQWEGVASGIGTKSYSAQIVIDAEDSDTAVSLAKEVFIDAAMRAGLPSWPIASTETLSEESELEDYE